MKYKELTQWIKDNLIQNSQLISHKLKFSSKFYIENKNHFNQITSNTNFLDNVKISERIYCVLNNIYSQPKCKCSKEVKFNSFTHGYREFCSAKCAGNYTVNRREFKEYSEYEYNKDLRLNISIKELKSLIKNELYRVDGFINGNKMKDAYISKNLSLFNEIYFRTKHIEDIEFSQRIYHIVNNIKEIPKCKCGSNTIFKDNTKGYTQFCSNVSCSREQALKRGSITKEEKYNNPTFTNPKKAKRTCLLRYGNENYNNSEQISLTKLNKSDLEKEEIKNKYIETVKDKYGVENTFQLDIVKTKSKQSKEKRMLSQKINYYNQCVKEYKDIDVTILTTLDEYLNNNYNIDFKCNKCKNTYNKNEIKSNGFFHECKICNKPKYKRTQKEIFDFIEANKVWEDRTLISPLEVDILIPNTLAIEYNGLMWHSFGKNKSSKFDNHLAEKENRNNHLNKTILCEEQGVQLFHIFENEWKDRTKQDIWKSMINSKLGLSNKIHARKCVIKEIDTRTKNEFLNNNHLQGEDKSAIKIGLYYKDELVSVMTFGKSRYNKNIEYELLRFSTIKNHTIVGGASKLLKYFERVYNPKSLISYANRRFSQGNVYEKLGFKFIENTKPNYFYFNNSELHSRVKFQKHKLNSILEVYDEDLTESENMYNNGYRKIYDCGNKSYLKQYKESK